MQIFNIGVAPQEPKQLVNNRAGMQFFRCDQRKTFLQVKTHLIAEQRTCAGAGSVRLADAVLIDIFHELFILVRLVHLRSFVFEFKT